MRIYESMRNQKQKNLENEKALELSGMVEALKALAAGGKNEQTGSVNYANLSRLGPFLARLDSRLGAVEDVAATEGESDLNVAEKRAEEAHDIIHRIAAILAME